MSLWDEHLGGIVDEGDTVYHEPGTPECVRRVKQIAEVLARLHLSSLLMLHGRHYVSLPLTASTLSMLALHGAGELAELAGAGDPGAAGPPVPVAHVGDARWSCQPAGRRGQAPGRRGQDVREHHAAPAVPARDRCVHDPYGHDVTWGANRCPSRGAAPDA